MLKLERVKNSAAIKVSLQKQAPLLTRPFVISLIIALGLHLCAYLMFKLETFTLSNDWPVYIPIQLETASPHESHHDASITASQDADITRRRLALIPTSVSPVPLKRGLVSPFARPDTLSPADKLELLCPTHSTLYPFTPVVIIPRGPLSDRNLMNVPVTQTVYLEANPLKKQLIYHVHIDEMTGQLIWWEPISSFGDLPNPELQAEHLLATLTLEPKMIPRISRGMIEITLMQIAEDEDQ